MNDNIKVLLVYPEFLTLELSTLLLRLRASAHATGTVDCFRNAAEHLERRLVDMNVQPLRSSDIEWADMVLTSAMIAQKASLREVVALSKAHGKRVVVGGPYITTSTTSVSEADHLFVGEAEETLPAFVRDIERGEARRIYQAAERPALCATPVPDFQLADLKRY
jgi:radical SAM superfamily enzyme YgiQ (UPF0313 family)